MFFVRPDGPTIELRVTPRLASWNVADDPDQLRLAAALDDAVELLAPHVGALSGPVALRLDVGLAAHIDLLHEHDLDNYALPLAARLTKTLGLEIVSMWATKVTATRSFIRCEPAILAQGHGRGVLASVRTTASSSTDAYKQQISDQLTEMSELPPGPIALELSLAVGPRRNWLNLWKPTIDALERLLGRSQPDRPWHPRDGRITELGLHRSIDTTLGNDIEVTIAARSNPGETVEVIAFDERPVEEVGTDLARRTPLRILQGVRLLHQRGYHAVRILPGMSASGLYWRVAIAPATEFTDADGHVDLRDWERAVTYTTGAGTEFVGRPVDATSSPDAVADLILASLPQLTPSASDPTYARWYAELLCLAEELDALPIAYADYFDDTAGWELGWGSGVRYPRPAPPS